MEYIPKQGLVQSESLRLALGTFAWTLGPSLGVWLYVRYGVLAPFIWSAGWTLILIALFVSTGVQLFFFGFLLQLTTQIKRSADRAVWHRRSQLDTGPAGQERPRPRLKEISHG